MRRKLFDWLVGWYNALIIKYREPALYALLCNKQNFQDEDFTEVSRPEAE